MRAIFWSIRGLNQPSRKNSLSSLIRKNQVDFVGVMETKKEVILPNFLDSLASPVQFVWHLLHAVGTTGGVLVGFRDDFCEVLNVTHLRFSLDCVIRLRQEDLVMKVVVVYGAPYDEGKLVFIDELHKVLGGGGWQGPSMIGGDFNLSRVAADKSNGQIKTKNGRLF
jgi:hypothetical protein